MAAGVVQLVAREEAATWPEAEGLAAHAAVLGDRCARLLGDNAMAYRVAARALEQPGAGPPLGPSLRAAAAVPEEIAEAAADIAELAANAPRRGGSDHHAERRPRRRPCRVGGGRGGASGQREPGVAPG